MALETNEKKLSTMFQFLHKFLSQKYKSGVYEGQSFIFQKMQQYQMYYAMNRLDADKFSNLDFAVNFGILPEVKKSFVQAMQTGGNYEDVCKTIFDSADTL